MGRLCPDSVDSVNLVMSNPWIFYSVNLLIHNRHLWRWLISTLERSIWHLFCQPAAFKRSLNLCSSHGLCLRVWFVTVSVGSHVCTFVGGGHSKSSGYLYVWTSLTDTRDWHFLYAFVLLLVPLTVFLSVTHQDGSQVATWVWSFL